MAHFAVVTPEDAGHMLAMGALANELVRRGHRLTILGRARAAPLAEQLGLPLHELDLDDAPYNPTFFWWLALRACGAGDEIVRMRNWLAWQAEAVLKFVPGALTELKVDGVLHDHVVSAAGTAAERASVPFVSVCTALLWNEDVGVPPSFTSWAYGEGLLAELRNRLGYVGWHWFIKPTLKAINRRRKEWNLPRFSRIDDALSPLAQISNLCEGLDFPRRALSDVFHYVGPLVPPKPPANDNGFPWDRLDGRPLIFASLGTVPDPANPPVFRSILAACAGLDVQLVLALGKWSDEHESLREQLGPIPGNAVVVDFAPQLALLDRAALLISHAGTNTVLQAIGRGVPMVALPRSADQPAVASRAAHAGVALLGSFWRSNAEEIRTLIERVLGDDSFRRRARQLQKAMLQAGGVRRAAEVAEEALLTRRPVTRQWTAPTDCGPGENALECGDTSALSAEAR